MKSKSHFLQDLNLNSILEPADPSDKNYCATKVVGTIGPACQAVDKQVAMLEAGMSAARWGCNTLLQVGVKTAVFTRPAYPILYSPI